MFPGCIISCFDRTGVHLKVYVCANESYALKEMKELTRDAVKATTKICWEELCLISALYMADS